MSSILKASIEDCQPWEPPSLWSGREGITTDHTTVSLPTIDQVTHIHEQARQEGLALGRTEGYAEGLAEGRAQAAQVAERLCILAQAFSAELARADEAISHSVLELALDLARAMLKTTLAVRPEAVIPVVRETINYLPGMKQPALLFLHPEDAALVRSNMGSELEKSGWNIAEDTHMERGGCRVETPSNQIDATASTRWQRIAAALGKQSDWLA